MISNSYTKFVSGMEFPILLVDIPHLQRSFDAQRIEHSLAYELDFVDGEIMADTITKLLTPEDKISYINNFLDWYQKHFIFRFEDYQILLNGDSNLENIVETSTGLVHIDLLEDFLCVTKSPVRAYLPAYLSLKKLGMNNEEIELINWPFEISLFSEFDQLDLESISDLNDHLIIDTREELLKDMAKGINCSERILYRFFKNGPSVKNEFYESYLKAWITNDINRFC